MNVPRYSLEFRPAAFRQLRKVDRQAARRIKAATEDLRMDPRPHGVIELTDRHAWLRIRVGDYRDGRNIKVAGAEPAHWRGLDADSAQMY